MSTVSDYYDGYVERQARTGINARHRAIAAGMRDSGWRPDSRVLEIGAGIGTLTALIAADLSTQGSLVANDLSPKSIDVARRRLAARANVELIAGDIFELDLAGPFDVIVLPDVIEHIPLDLHGQLFARLAAWLADDGFIYLNYPNPYYLAWCRDHKPELLQVIDQPIYSDILLPHIYSQGLYVALLETYSLWIEEGDYVRAVLRRVGAAQTWTTLSEKPPSLIARAAGRVRRLLSD